MAPIKNRSSKAAMCACLALVLVALVAAAEHSDEEPAVVQKAHYNCRHIGALLRSGGDSRYREHKKDLKQDTRERCAICCDSFKYKYNFLKHRADDWHMCRCTDSIVARVFTAHLGRRLA